MTQQYKMKSNIKKYTFKQGLPQEFEIVGIADLYKEFEDTLTTLHRSVFYHIVWFQKGCPTHLVDFNPVKVKPNTILFLNKDTVQRFDSKSDFDGKAILFTDSFFVSQKWIQNFYKTVFCSMTSFLFRKFKYKRNLNYLLICYNK